MIDTRALLLEILDHAFDRTAWHGPNLTGALRGVTPESALQRPAPQRKCIWEHLLHAAYWKRRALNKLTGTQRFPRSGSNWPRLPETPSLAAWKGDLKLLRDLHRELRHAVWKLPEARLKYPLRRMIHGAAAHDIYHAGQIRLIRRLISQAPPEVRSRTPILTHLQGDRDAGATNPREPRRFNAPG